MIKTIEEAKKYLGVALETIDPIYKSVCQSLLENPEFWICPASRPEKKGHHSYPGGLAIHTAQVLEAALSFSEALPNCARSHLIVAAIWHDAGKIKDYSLGITRPHYTMIKHLSASFAMFYKEAKEQKLLDEEIELIGHMILSHHGRLEWGSPVEPTFPEAWILHAADMLSAHFLGKDDNALSDHF